DAGGTRHVRVHATTRVAAVGVAVLVVVLVKSFQTDAAIRGAQSLVGPGTAVLALQNGLGHEDILIDVVGRERVLAGKTYVGVSKYLTISIEWRVIGKTTYIGELDGR
ncbi:ketopantoate reductase family protein, partial [Burkholderia sp. GbtcB21]|uniref:ketopantoate reductase family protein n=1 Tax=Burkholderia sp. GbtcB21 TaxID=2824766 RepID=UPI0020C72467